MARSRSLLCGIGVNDADYVTEWIEDGRRVVCPYYRKWKNMLARCTTLGSYQATRVTDNWLVFTRFSEWMTAQAWQGNQLDKDFLGDGTLYSAETCVFVPQWLNLLFLGNPKGYSYDASRNAFSAKLNVDGKTKNLGRFCSGEEARQAYIEAKGEYVRSKYTLISEVDPRLVAACEKKLNQLKGTK